MKHRIRVFVRLSVTDIDTALTLFRRHLSFITEQNHGNMRCICFNVTMQEFIGLQEAILA